MKEGRLQFFNLVKAMREAQKEYFTSRSLEALRRSKQLERKVDEYIMRGDIYLMNQNKDKELTLFDNGD
jgi:hypothetical protein